MRLTRCFLALCLLPMSAIAGSGEVHQLAVRFDQRFRAVMAQERIPGGAYAVVYKGIPIRVGVAGTADVRTGRPVDPDTVFRVGSVSKGFAASVAGLLVREGRFAWSDPITRFVPDFRFRGNPRTISVSDVVGQSTGFIPHAYDNLLEAGKPLREIWRHFASLAPICPAGSCYTYQNSAFGLIEPVVEQSADEAYSQLVEDRLFKPLNMGNASTGYGAYWASSDRAAPHVEVRQKHWRAVKVEPNYYAVNSAAGVNASIRDMADWAIAALGHRPDVLPPAVLDRVMTPRVHTERELHRKHWRDCLDNAWYGLGWRIYQMGDEQLVYHAGWVRGFVAEISLSRRHDLGLVILLNGESNAISELGSHFWPHAFSVLDRPAVAGGPDSKATSAVP